ncbi:hypothetical protein BC830DRAFT_1104129 [Chytriomyces sp. MP71]|nr:hypothetical protein BC830DRAFT_1104129 [Chytriomyces sp. MP71]
MHEKEATETLMNTTVNVSSGDNWNWAAVTSENEPFFWILYGVDMPVFCVGLILNSLILFTYTMNWRWLLRDRLDRILALLVGCSLIWCIKNLVGGIWMLYSYSPRAFISDNVLVALCLNLSFWSNLLLALERYAVVREIQYDRTKLYLLISVAFMLFCSTAIITLGFAITDIAVLQKALWIAFMPATLLVTTVTTVTLYANSYLYTRARLIEANLGPAFDISRAKASVLKNCIVMTASFAFSFLPSILSMMGVFASGVDPASSRVAYFFEALGYVCGAVDGVLTPLLTLYFVPELRHACRRLLVRGRVGRVGVVVPPEMLEAAEGSFGSIASKGSVLSKT